MNRVFQIERFDQLREIIGVGVHVVAVPRLARSAMAATVMGDAAIAARGQIKHLVLKGVRAQRPAVAEDHGLSAAPVFVIDIDVSGIFFADINVWHRYSPLFEKFKFGPFLATALRVLRRQRSASRGRSAVSPFPCRP